MLLSSFGIALFSGGIGRSRLVMLMLLWLQVLRVLGMMLHWSRKIYKESDRSIKELASALI
jgi:asparagine synthetase A